MVVGSGASRDVCGRALIFPARVELKIWDSGRLSRESEDWGYLIMEEGYTKESLLVLRRLTRAISDLLREPVKGYLSALAPLLRPRSTLGEHVQ